LNKERPEEEYQNKNVTIRNGGKLEKRECLGDFAISSNMLQLQLSLKGSMAKIEACAAGVNEHPRKFPARH